MRKLSSREKVIVALVVVGLLVFVVQRLVVEPRSRKLVELRKQLASVEEQYASLVPKLAEFKTLGSALAKKERELAELEQVLSYKAEVAEIIHEVSRQVRNQGLQIQYLRPQKTTVMRTRSGRQGEFRHLVLNLGIRGRYEQLGNFLGELQQQQYYVRVAQLHMERGGAPGPLLEVQLKLELVVRS